MGDGGHRVSIASYGRYKEGVKSVLGSALLCGLVCPLLPFLGPLVSPALTYSSQPPPKPALQSDEHSRVSGPRWTLWSQVRGTIPLLPGSPVSVCSCAYLQFPVSKSALASAVPALISESHRALNLACPCLIPLLSPASLLPDFHDFHLKVAWVFPFTVSPPALPESQSRLSPHPF